MENGGLKSKLCDFPMMWIIFFSIRYVKELKGVFRISMKSFVAYESYAVLKIYVLFY